MIFDQFSKLLFQGFDQYAAPAAQANVPVKRIAGGAVIGTDLHKKHLFLQGGKAIDDVVDRRKSGGFVPIVVKINVRFGFFVNDFA